MSLAVAIHHVMGPNVTGFQVSQSFLKPPLNTGFVLTGALQSSPFSPLLQSPDQAPSPTPFLHWPSPLLPSLGLRS